MTLGKDHDTIPRPHQFSAPDMTYIKSMNLVNYELFDLSKDIGQNEDLIHVHSKSALYKKMIDEKLEEIQVEGYHWKHLPEASGRRRGKTEWVKY